MSCSLRFRPSADGTKRVAHSTGGESNPIPALHVTRRWSGRLKARDGIAVMPRIDYHSKLPQLACGIIFGMRNSRVTLPKVYGTPQYLSGFAAGTEGERERSPSASGCGFNLRGLMSPTGTVSIWTS